MSTAASTVWWPIPGVEGYEIGDAFEVRRRDLGGQLSLVTPSMDGQGYLTVVGPTGRLFLHHLVAAVIHGEPVSGEVVRHLDDDRSNNYPSNLAYGTQADNIADSLRNGTFPVGERNGRAVLTAGKVRRIRERVAAGETLTAVARSYRVAVRTIAKVVSRENWRHVP